MTTPKPSPAAPVTDRREETELEPLTEAQREFLDDLRVSLIQMKNGDVMPAREACSRSVLSLKRFTRWKSSRRIDSVR